MKKSFFVILIFVLLGLSLNAQDYKTSLGLKIGYPYGGISMKHFMNETNAVEGVLSISFGGFVATALLENEHWTGKYPGLNWFWGAGAHVGFWDAGANKYINSNYNGSVIGIDGIIGLEYTFDEIPLNLSVEALPTLNIIGSFGWGGIFPGISIRYVF